jgi:hypothetical protein
MRRELNSYNKLIPSIGVVDVVREGRGERFMGTCSHYGLLQPSSLGGRHFPHGLSAGGPSTLPPGEHSLRDIDFHLAPTI